MDINDLSLLILHNGVMSHDAYGQLAALGGAVFYAQKFRDKGG